MIPVSNPSTDYVYIPVPVQRADEALALLAPLFASLEPHVAASPRQGVALGALTPGAPYDPGPADPVGPGSYTSEVGNPNGVWPESGYAAFAASRTTSAGRLRDIVSALIAAGPGVAVRMRPLAEATGLTPNEIRSALGKLTQFIKNHPEAFGDECKWPLGWKYGANVDPEHAREFHYYMSAEQIAAWQAHV